MFLEKPRNAFLDDLQERASKIPLGTCSWTVGRVDNQKSLIFLKSQAGFHGAHKNEVIHQVLKTKNIRFHIGKCHFMGLILRSFNISRIMTV